MKLTEKNRIILKHALRDLKGYTPPDHIWSEIETDLTQSELDEPLHDALDESSGFYPPNEIWDNIEVTLEQKEADEILQKGIAQLKPFNPPDDIWNNIEQALDPASGKVIRMSWMKKMMAVAAIGLLFWMALPHFMSADSAETVTYSEEIMAANNDKLNWDEDESDFGMIAEWCKSGNIVCQLPEFKALKAEMDELNQAKNMLKSEISKFETDDYLLAKLTRIEIERGDVLKQMISLM